MFPNLKYFEELQIKINGKLLDLSKNKLIPQDIVDTQIDEYPWLYGALGKLPTDEMFIAENPSFAGVKKADIDTIDGKEPDIEAQWWGGHSDKAAVVFRTLLFELGLKTTPPDERNGWECYITNVIKQADYTKNHKGKSAEYRYMQSEFWWDILKWEIDKVQPKIIYCLGGNAYDAVSHLVGMGKIIPCSYHKVWHYSAYRSKEEVINRMKSKIEEIRRMA